jgi:TIR domain
MSRQPRPQLVPVVISPSQTNVSYLQPVTVAVSFRNVGRLPVVLDDCKLIFQRDYGLSEEATATTVSCHGRRVPSQNSDYITVPAVPALLCSRATNTFKAIVSYRLEAKSGLGRKETVELGGPGYFIIVDDPPMVGQAFVSFKDPEDAALADLAADLLRKGGFAPYLAKRETRVGGKYWREKIPNAIGDSRCTLVIWTKNTARRPQQVRREIRMSRAKGKFVALLRESEVELPPEYLGEQFEYVSFCRESAVVSFASAITSLQEGWRAGRL